MRNKIIESTIEKVIDESNYPNEFKESMKKYIKNRFDNIAVSDSDLARVLALLDDEEEEEQ